MICETEIHEVLPVDVSNFVSQHTAFVCVKVRLTSLVAIGVTLRGAICRHEIGYTAPSCVLPTLSYVPSTYRGFRSWHLVICFSETSLYPISFRQATLRTVPSPTGL